MNNDNELSGGLILHVVRREIPLTELSDFFAGFSQPRIQGWQIILHLTYKGRVNIPIPLVFRESSIGVEGGNRSWRQKLNRKGRQNEYHMEIVGLSRSVDDDKLTLTCPFRDDLIVKLSKGQRLALALPLEGPDIHMDEVRSLLAAYLATRGSDVQIFDRILYQAQRPVPFDLDTCHARVSNDAFYWRFELPVSHQLQESLNLIAESQRSCLALRHLPPHIVEAPAFLF